MGRSGSEKILTCDRLNKSEDDQDVGEEFGELCLENDDRLSTEHVMITESSDPKNLSQNDLSESDKGLKKSADSGEKHDDDTNISAIKISFSSGSRNLRESSPQSNKHKK